MEDKGGVLESLKTMLENKELVDVSSLKVGDIIYVSLDEDDGLILKDGYKSRMKYIVIIGFTPEGHAVGSLLINSNINPLLWSEEMMNCQYPLRRTTYPYILDYDSWLDCSDIFEISKLKMSMNKARLKGRLCDEDCQRVMGCLRISDVIDNATKRRYGIIKDI